jgi:transposase
VAESFEPGAGTSAVALRHGLHRNQLYAWRRELRDGGSTPISTEVEFAPVVVADEAARIGASAIEVALGGAVVRVGPGADPVQLAEIFRLLKRLG